MNIEYDANEFSEVSETSVEKCLDSKNKTNVSWINVIGIHDPEVIQKFGNAFDVHTLHVSLQNSTFLWVAISSDAATGNAGRQRWRQTNHDCTGFFQLAPNEPKRKF